MGSSHLIETALPQFHAREIHSMDIPAACDRVYDQARRLDFRGSPVIRFLMTLRGIRGAREQAFRRTFVPLAEEPGREFVIGIAGRF